MMDVLKKDKRLWDGNTLNKTLLFELLEKYEWRNSKGKIEPGDISHFAEEYESLEELEACGKPSTWLPPEELVELLLKIPE